jgi:hypothetical protein
VEARSLVGLPTVFAATARLDRKTMVVTVRGRVTAAGKPVARRAVTFQGGPGRSPAGWSDLGRTVTKADGSFTFRRRAFGPLYLFPYTLTTGRPCSAAASAAPGGCVSESTAAALGPLLHVSSRP